MEFQLSYFKILKDDASLGLEDLLEKEMATLSVFLTGNPMDRGSWQAIVHVVAESLTWLRTHTHSVQCP